MAQARLLHPLLQAPARPLLPMPAQQPSASAQMARPGAALFPHPLSPWADPETLPSSRWAHGPSSSSRPSVELRPKVLELLPIILSLQPHPYPPGQPEGQAYGPSKGSECPSCPDRLAWSSVSHVMAGTRLGFRGEGLRLAPTECTGGAQVT